jgi:haloalkane dehalogenase
VDAARIGRDAQVKFARTPETRFLDLPDYPFAPCYRDVAAPDGTALRMHYLDEGPADAAPVLMVHGEPTWSFLYRKLVPPLVDAGCRVIVPDQIGFGKSDKPVANTAYSFERHIGWLQQLVAGLDLRRITLVCQDWGGPISLGVLAREPDRFARVVVANTMLHTVEPALAGRLAWANHGVGDGDAQVSEALLTWISHAQRSEHFEASTAAQGASLATLSDPVLRAYDAPFPDERHKAGMRQFPLLIPISRFDPGAEINRRAWEALSSFEKPLLTAFGDSDPGTAGWDTIFQERSPGAAGQPHTTIAGAGHFLQEDQPERLAEVVIDFLKGTGSPGGAGAFAIAPEEA